MTYNVVGGFGWGIGLTVLGYFLGKSIPADQIDRYLLPITLLIMFISLAPSIFHILKARQRGKN
jgi:membrane-associated protein